MKLIRGMQWPDAQKEHWVYSLPERDGLLQFGDEIRNTAIGLCRRKRLAIDGGAHVGLWTLPMAQEFKEVIAFEPQPENADCLAINAELENVTIHRTALAETEGHGNLEGHPSKTVGWSLAKFREGQIAYVVRKMTIDSLEFKCLDFLKLDVEGYEYEALVGGRETIIRHRPVIVIEEKLDPNCRASKLLGDWGMRFINQVRYDRLFIW